MADVSDDSFTLAGARATIMPDDQDGEREREGSQSAKPTRKPPLHRNMACQACKRKKRKCDGAKPVCGPCSNSARLYQEAAQCEWPSAIPAGSGAATSSSGPPSAEPAAIKQLHGSLQDPRSTAAPGVHDNDDEDRSSRSFGRYGAAANDQHPLPGSSTPDLSLSFSSSTSPSSHGLPNGRPAKMARLSGPMTTSQTTPTSPAIVVPSTTPSAGRQFSFGPRIAPASTSSPQIEHLQAKIAELEDALRRATTGLGRPLDPSQSSNDRHSRHHLRSPEIYVPTPPLTQSAGSAGFSSPRSVEGGHHLASAQQDPAVKKEPSASGQETFDNHIPAQSSSRSAPNSPMQSLTWTPWPPDLPSLRIVKMLCESGLAMISTLSIIPAESFFHSLALSPADPRFPAPALLHALCALATTMVPLPNDPESQTYWKSAPSPSQYHFRCARRHIGEFAMHTVLDNCRACLLLAMFSFATEQFIEVWQIVGLAARSIAPAGLNHVQNNCALPSSKIAVTPGHFIRKETFLPNAVDDFDVFYRTTTLWQIYMCDVWMSACSGWSPAMSIEDISSLLPVWPSDTSPLDIVLNQPSLDPHSPLFMSHHLESPIIALHLNIKAMIVLSRVCSFLQRATLPGNTINLEVKERIRDSQAFLDLHNLIAAFQQAIPGPLRDPIRQLRDGRLDANLINAHVVPAVAFLLLYEPFIYNSDDDPGFKQSVMAATTIHETTERIYAHSGDQISYYNTPINYCWMVANRTLIRAMRFREDAGDIEKAKRHKEQVEFLLARITPLSARSPLVSSCLVMLESLIKDESPWHKG